MRSLYGMGSLPHTQTMASTSGSTMAAFPSLPADPADHPLTHPPELNDADYAHEVLKCTNESDIDAALAQRAADLGISLPLPRPMTDGVPTTTSSDAESDNTIVSQHGRTASTSSNDTTNTGLTSQTSHRSAVIPATLTETTNIASRRRSKSLSFSQYEKYLSQVDPTAHQPKFLHPPATRTDWPISPLIGTGRRRSVRDLKRTIAGKLRRRRPIPSLTLV